MLPLSFAQNGETVMVAKIGGSDEVKKHLEDLGFVVGATLSGFVAKEQLVGTLSIVSKLGVDVTDAVLPGAHAYLS